MRYRRILLIRFYTKVGYGARRPPTGLGYIAESLARHDIEYDVLDCDLGYLEKDIYKKVSSFKPDLVGISMVTLGYLTFYEIVNNIKKNFSCDVIVGGPHISTLREQVLQECNGVDYGVVGEGDNLILELCNGKAIDQIDGLLYRDSDNIKFNSPSNPILNLDAFKFPTYKGFELEKYFGFGSEISIVTSRGCPYGCTFCAVRLIMGTKIRFRSASNVVDEFEYWMEKGYNRFAVMDDNFSQDRQRVFEICDEVEARGIKGMQISLANGLRADKTDPEMLRRLRDIGAYEIKIGVEAASDRVLKIIRKGEKLATIEEAIQNSIEAGYEVGANFLIGSPGETWDEVQSSFAFALKYPLARAFFFNIIPYPGTRIFKEIEIKGKFRSTPDEYLGVLRQNENYPIFETPELSIEQRERLILQGQKVSEKVRRRFMEIQFAGFGFLAKLLAFFAAWHLTEPLLKRSKLINKYILPFYYRLIKK